MKLVDVPIVPALFAKMKRIAVLKVEIRELEHKLASLRARQRRAEEDRAWAEHGS